MTESENPIETPWSPLVGDHIQIVATGTLGVVMGISKSRHFVVAVYSPVLRAVTTAPHRTFTLRELGPTSTPPAVDAAVSTAPQRGARQKPPAE